MTSHTTYRCIVGGVGCNGQLEHSQLVGEVVLDHDQLAGILQVVNALSQLVVTHRFPEPEGREEQFFSFPDSNAPGSQAEGRRRLRRFTRRSDNLE